MDANESVAVRSPNCDQNRNPVSRRAHVSRQCPNNRAIVTAISGQQLQEIYVRNGAGLVLYARQWCDLPDDALQEALMELVKLDECPRDVVAWLYKVVRCKALNIARSEKRRSNHQRQAVEQRDDWFSMPHDSQAEAREIQSALNQLPNLEREIVTARIWGELSFEQISQLTGKPTSTVHRRFDIALEKLRHMIEGGETIGADNCEHNIK